MENTGSIGSVVQADSPSTEVSLTPSAVKDKRSTRKTKSLDPEQLLEILEDILTRCKDQGWQVRVGNFFEEGDKPKVGIIIDGIKLEGNRLLPLMANENEKSS